MNKLKNIGISALAGALVSLSAAEAGGVSVTGSWELSYTNLNHEKNTGNKLGMNKNISFGSSGDISDGGAVTWASTVAMSDAAGLTSASMNINMGGIATLAYDSGTGGYGANAVDNVVPTAWEEIDYGLSTGIADLGMVSSSKGVVNLTIKAPGSGTGVSISYVSRIGGGHIADGATSGELPRSRGWDAVVDLVNYSSPHFGMRLGFAAEIEKPDQNCRDLMQKTSEAHQNSCSSTVAKYDPYGGSAYTTLALGPIHLGVQATFKDPADGSSDGIANKRNIVAGVAFVAGDTLSVSYGKAFEKYRYNDDGRGENARNEDEYSRIEYRGWSAAVNMGPVALKGTRNKVDGMGENGSSAPRSHSEINLSIAF